MTEQAKETQDPADLCEPEEDSGGVNTPEYWSVLKKRRKMIGCIVAATVVLTSALSLFMTNIYQAKAVIIPVTVRESGSMGNASLAALASQIGGLPGISSPSAATSSEIVGLLNSNVLREKMIKQYNLMPVMFYKKWDVRQNDWKKGSAFSKWNPLVYLPSLTKTNSGALSKNARKKNPDAPDTWDALRMLDDMVKVNRNLKDNTITIFVDFYDPEMAARIAEYYLLTLTDYMSSEAKRVAATNRKYLEEQLGNTTDPIIKQKTYNMIAEQIETGMMAEVKENFAFKVIDPPLAPDRKIKPIRSKMVLLSLFISLILSICVAFFLEYLKKNKMKNGEVGI